MSADVRDLHAQVIDMLRAGHELSELKGIGNDLSRTIEELAKTGTTPLLDRLRRGRPLLAHRSDRSLFRLDVVASGARRRSGR